MKKYAHLLLFLSFLGLLCVVAPACSKKSGCPATESLKPKLNKDGSFKVKKKKKREEGLYPRKMSKKK